MKSILFACACFLSAQNASAQLSGKLTTGLGEPLPFANVLVMYAEDSSFVRGAVTDELGAYVTESVTSGTYLLRFSAVGYQTMLSGRIAVLDGQGPLNLGTQVLESDVQQLGEFVVKGEKPLFQQEIDRTVVNVENSVLIKGSSALQVLERSPGVIVDMRNGSISLNGKSSIMLMINGKTVRLSVTQVVSMLNNMTANDIEKIELITTPPAKYDADGTGGMINIVLKKNLEAGTKVSVAASAGYGWGQKGSGSLNVTRRNGKWNVFGSYAYLHDKTRDGYIAWSTQDMPAFGGKLDVFGTSTNTAVSNSQNALFGTDLYFGKNTVGTSISYNGNRTERNVFNTGSYLRIASDSLLSLETTISGKNRWDNVNASVYLDSKFREGEKLNVDLDFMHYLYDNPTEGETIFYDKRRQQIFPEGNIFSGRQMGKSRTPIAVGVLKMDYIKELNAKWRLEAGAKATLTNSTSNSYISQFIDGEWTRGPRYINNIAMHERIGAAYTSLFAQINPSISVSAGLRYEFSKMKAEADKNERDVNRKLGKLFPAIFINKKINEQSALQLSYTKRISRPSFNDLSSYLQYNDPMSVSTGNPALRPTITNNLKFGYNFNGYAFSITASRDNDPIILYQQQESPARDLMYFAPQNMRFQNNLSFQASGQVKVSNWWNTTYALTSGWRQFQLEHTIEKLKKTYFAYSFNGSQTFSIPGQIALEISGWYNSKQFEGSKRIEGFGMLNAGLKKELKHNLGSFQFTVTDVFKSMRVNGHFGELTKEAFDLKADFIYKSESARTRIFKLTYTRSFGNSGIKLQASRSEVSKEERARIR
ncbi:outer membrane beta-barrel protein [Dyadobacter sp. CY326]|uniref:outer membrane beta-barrel protein n=1 Tax=Dyadobacter sp. CY326 TaxID=2907300 RepID=UPI001F3EE5D7|nr:outer membrane beta-barrel protein [Dyadobacter sp. CY326]MCE7066970.1 TonB-dependent receptor [Dyadobacter sp. CY326]